MKKETRAYLLEIDNAIVRKKLLSKSISELTDDEFIESAEQFGDVMTLSKLQNLINNDNIIMSDFYIRFIEVEIYELVMTRRDWFETLPEDIRDKAINNTDEHMIDTECNSFLGAICSSFTWKDSPEGADYWLNVKKEYEEQLANDLWERSAE